VVLNQPFSSLLVYALGALWIWAGIRFWNTREGQACKTWWSISLVLGGVAALSAGTSYQAFGYELKCAGREFCSWTSWWEIAYMSLQVASFNSMLIAVSYSCAAKVLRRTLITYACINYLLHLFMTVLGVITLNSDLLSYELAILFTTPTIALYFLLNGWRYFKYRQVVDLVLLGSWVILVITNTIYYAYLSSAYTQVLWEKGIWFSENDVLHLLVMGWLIYIAIVVMKNVCDYSDRTVDAN